MRHHRRLLFALAALGAGIAVTEPGSSQTATAQLDGHYTKRLAMIPMRDGTKLHTQIFEPTNPEGRPPILLNRTPYGMRRYDTTIARRWLGPSPLFSALDYVFVYQDVRGQHGSEGEFRVLRPPRTVRSDPRAVDETTDAFDTIEWLLDHVPDHNGRVGMWGISYGAWQTVMAMADAHPALVAVSPQASPGDMFVGDDIHHHGAFRLHYMFGWLAHMASTSGLLGPKRGRFDFGTDDAYAYFLGLGPLGAVDERVFRGRVPAWTEYMTHGVYDAYWRQRNPLRLMRDVRPAALHVAGWFDAEDFRGPLEIYDRTEVDGRRDANYLVVGPWRHGGWNALSGDTGASLGRATFGAGTSAHFRRAMERPFFEHHLRDGPDPQLAPVTAFETGGNRWHPLAQWPPVDVEPQPLYLRAEGGASFGAAPNAADPPAFDEFVSDPADPVPSAARRTMRFYPERMVEDQQFVASRPDVLTYVTAPLANDVVIAGAAEAQLCFSTTGSDADWVVKLIDVHPEDDDPAAAFHMLLAAEIFRAKFRESFARPVPVTSNALTDLRFRLPDRFHRFRAGHRIMIQIHSTWFPLYDRNPQTCVDIYRAAPAAFVKATHRVYRSGVHSSRLILPVRTP
ncbi:MAG: CocE/NonD family hydrolase [Planctomycetota bacterium]